MISKFVLISYKYKRIMLGNEIKLQIWFKIRPLIGSHTFVLLYSNLKIVYEKNLKLLILN